MFERKSIKATKNMKETESAYSKAEPREEISLVSQDLGLEGASLKTRGKESIVNNITRYRVNTQAAYLDWQGGSPQ